MKIIIDTLGADLGFEEVVKGCIEAVKESSSNLTLVGPEEEIRNIITRKNADINRFDIINTDIFIENNEEPVKAIRKKKDSSIVLGLNLLNEQGYDGLISCGSTGGLLAGGLFIIKRIDNVERAVITAAIPTRKGATILVDTGAVMDSTSDMLDQFATMGSIYSSTVLNKSNPKVYLLNVGSEEGKGDNRAKKTFKVLEENKSINFMGNIEARDFLTGKADVIVSDAFAGNIALKTLEGVAGTLFKEIKEGAMSKFRYKMGALLMKPVFKDISEMYSYREVGSAMLLGIKKPVFKAHGSSDSHAVKNAILNAEKIIKTDIIDKIEREFSND